VTKNVLSGRLAVDASVLVELAFSTKAGKELLDLILAGEVEPRTTEVADTELRYILCRRLGRKEAEERASKLRVSGYLPVDSISTLIQAASVYKCERAISLADCFSLAQARWLNCAALFSRKEKDLLKEMAKRPFDVEIKFLHE